MEKKDNLWNKFYVSGKVEDYLNYRNEVNRKEKLYSDEHGRTDNQRKEYR